jgi:group I intron endonuclease
MSFKRFDPNVYGYVYIIRNKFNGKVYIGQTIQCVKERWRCHIKDTRQGVRLRLHNAIRKYGPDAFDVAILHHAFSKEELDDLEKRSIWSHDSCNSQEGYNISLGGNGSGCVSEETKRKISNANKGRSHTEEAKKKMSIAKKGCVSPNKGRKFSAEHRRRLSEAHKGNKSRAKVH